MQLDHVANDCQAGGSQALPNHSLRHVCQRSGDYFLGDYGTVLNYGYG